MLCDSWASKITVSSIINATQHTLFPVRPMPIYRFYCPCELQTNTTITLPDDVSHHALRVLRLKRGSTIRLFNGQGGWYAATLESEGKTALASITQHYAEEAELKGRITLVQGIASGDKMDWIVEKAVELGVTEFIPIAARRSVLQLSGERLNKRMQHWQRVIKSASEQCGRNRLMQLHPVSALGDYLGNAYALAHDKRLFCHPDANLSLAEALCPAPEMLTLLVGPEGGWSEEERALARQHSLTAVQFGRRVLRTETAGLALVSACSALLNWN